MAVQRIQKGDTVVVIAARTRARPARSCVSSRRTTSVIVEGINLVKRHMKPNPRMQQGGILEREQPMHACKVMLGRSVDGQGHAHPRQDRRQGREGPRRREERRRDPVPAQSRGSVLRA